MSAVVTFLIQTVRGFAYTPYASGMTTSIAAQVRKNDRERGCSKRGQGVRSFIDGDGFGVCSREFEDALSDQLAAGMDARLAAQWSCGWTLARLKDAEEDACEGFEG